MKISFTMTLIASPADLGPLESYLDARIKAPDFKGFFGHISGYGRNEKCQAAFAAYSCLGGRRPYDSFSDTEFSVPKDPVKAKTVAGALRDGALGDCITALARNRSQAVSDMVHRIIRGKP